LWRTRNLVNAAYRSKMIFKGEIDFSDRE
jgi:hypothetical protein